MSWFVPPARRTPHQPFCIFFLLQLLPNNHLYFVVPHDWQQCQISTLTTVEHGAIICFVQEKRKSHNHYSWKRNLSCHINQWQEGSMDNIYLGNLLVVHRTDERGLYGTPPRSFWNQRLLLSFTPSLIRPGHCTDPLDYNEQSL